MYIIVYYSLLVYYRALVITTSPPRPWNPAPRSTCPPLSLTRVVGTRGVCFLAKVSFFLDETLTSPRPHYRPLA